MNQLELLQSFYTGRTNPVLFLDAQWNVIWTNHAEMAWESLAAQLKCLHNGWLNGTHQAYAGSQRFQCEILCNEQEQLRIVTLTPLEDNLSMSSADFNTMSEGVQTILTSLYALNSEIAEYEADEQCSAHLNVIFGALLKAYRIPFLHYMFKQLCSGEAERKIFCITPDFQFISRQVRSILRSHAEVIADSMAPDMMVQMNQRHLKRAILCGILLCFQDIPNLQQIRLTLEQVSPETGCIRICSEALPSEVQSAGKLRKNLSDNTLEAAYLDKFCQQNGCNWMIQNLSKEQKVCGVFQFPLYTDASTLFFSSAVTRNMDSVFNDEVLMLSKITHRLIF